MFAWEMRRSRSSSSAVSPEQASNRRSLAHPEKRISVTSNCLASDTPKVYTCRVPSLPLFQLSPEARCAAPAK